MKYLRIFKKSYFMNGIFTLKASLWQFFTHPIFVRSFFNYFLVIQLINKPIECNYSVPLFEKEGLGEILLDKSPSIPLFQRGRWILTIELLAMRRNIFDNRYASFEQMGQSIFKTTEPLPLLSRVRQQSVMRTYASIGTSRYNDDY